MKNIGPLLVLGLVLLVALVVFLMFGPLGEKPGMRYVEDTPEAPVVKPRQSAGKAAPVEAQGEQARAGAQSESVPGVAPNSQPGAPTAAVSVPERKGHPFPLASDIAVGADRSAVTASFGKPSMVTTAVDGGRLLETYVYLRRDPNTATVVLLRSGRVVAVNSTVY